MVGYKNEFIEFQECKSCNFFNSSAMHFSLRTFLSKQTTQDFCNCQMHGSILKKFLCFASFCPFQISKSCLFNKHSFKCFWIAIWKYCLSLGSCWKHFLLHLHFNFYLKNSWSSKNASFFWYIDAFKRKVSINSRRWHFRCFLKI